MNLRPITMEEVNNHESTWVFTFGCGQPNAGHFVRIKGTFEDAREEMFRRYGKHWAYQYSEAQWKDWCDKCIAQGGANWIEKELVE